MPEQVELTPAVTGWVNRLAVAARVEPLAAAAQGAEHAREAEHEHEHETVHHDSNGNNGPVPGLRELKSRLGEAGMVTADRWGEVGAYLEQEKQNAIQKYRDITRKLDKERKDINYDKHSNELLPILDAPSNNPERGKITKMLGEWQALAAEDPHPLTVDHADAKTRLLNKMQGEVGLWLNRRTAQGLPLSAEALALGDMLQAEHQRLIKAYVESPDWGPPPVADQNLLSDADKKGVAILWKRLVERSLVIRTFTPKEGETEASKDFHVEMMAAMARLLGSAEGRELLIRLETELLPTSEKPERYKFVHINPGDAATANSAKEGSVSTGMDPRRPAQGSGVDFVKITIPAKRLDSEMFYQTENGNKLYVPVQITLAHELLHALHDVQGLDRVNFPFAPNKKKQVSSKMEDDWTNYEELWTISGGKFDGTDLGPSDELCEQTIRHACGLSAERFGHSTISANKSVFDAAKHAADGTVKFASKEATVTTKLQARRFPADQLEQMPDWVKWDLYKKGTNGPIPNGWDPSQLTAVLIAGIIKDKLQFDEFQGLGWNACNLKYRNGPRLERGGFKGSLYDVIKGSVFHPRSFIGRRYIAHGGRASMDKMLQHAALLTDKGIDCPRWSNASWIGNYNNLAKVHEHLLSGMDAATRAGLKNDNVATTLELIAVPPSNTP